VTSISTPRLELVPATPGLVRAAIAGRAPLAEALTVEVGYGIVSEQRRRGYATEVTRGLLSRAFALPGVRRAIAETLPELVGSIGVLEKCGFRLLGAGSEPGVIRFELLREEFG